MGYNVKVVHLCNALPRIYSWGAKLLGNYGMKHQWSVSFLKPNRSKANYKIEGIPITYIPVVHYIPRVEPSDFIRRRAYKYALSVLEKDGFIPDLVVGHWHGSAYYMPYIKHDFPNTKTSVVIHNHSVYQEQFHSLFNYIDTWGFRCRALKESFEKAYGSQAREFICLSGVPSEYVPVCTPVKNFSKGVCRFVFVGKLLRLKNIDVTIKALRECYGDENYVFDIVGDGSEKDSLISLVKELKADNHVVFHGKLSRDAAQAIVEKAQVFVMVSSPEAFGLVYVEAMAKGCIPIATINQGADGFIVDGQNGYLCEANNVDSLKSVINTIRNMDEQQLISLSENAYKTASDMTDEKVAISYLRSVDY